MLYNLMINILRLNLDIKLRIFIFLSIKLYTYENEKCFFFEKKIYLKKKFQSKQYNIRLVLQYNQKFIKKKF